MKDTNVLAPHLRVVTQHEISAPAAPGFGGRDRQREVQVAAHQVDLLAGRAPTRQFILRVFGIEGGRIDRLPNDCSLHD